MCANVLFADEATISEVCHNTESEHVDVLPHAVLPRSSTRFVRMASRKLRKVFVLKDGNAAWRVLPCTALHHTGNYSTGDCFGNCVDARTWLHCSSSRVVPWFDK